MDSPEPGDASSPDDLTGDLSLQEAAETYDLSLRTLGNRVRCGEIEAYKTRGPWGQEWRVSRKALESFGYRPRQTTETSSADTAGLERELEAARRAAVAERNRADQADRKLGEAMREIGRLRALRGGG